jgi:sodium-dependent phosphate cotransporter
MPEIAKEWDTKVMESTEKEWSERTSNEKVLFVTIQCLKGVTALLLLYIFIISLGLMGNAFKILGGPTAGKTFRNNEIFDNPFAGCSLGILATVLVQSSSTSTSIIISMTASLLIKPENAIYMIMGANIGTSVTNTIVSMTQIGNVDQYRRAFAGATVHDCFNLLTVAILLPVEYLTHMLYHIGSGLVDAAGITDETEKGNKVDFLKVITKPLSSRMIAVDKKLVTNVAKASTTEELDSLLKKSMIKNKRTDDNFIFLDTPMNDQEAGWLLLVVSLVMLSTTLILFVKLLQTIFRGRVAIWMQSVLNLEIKSVPYLGDYILLLFGAGVTILFQSSSITTSTLTPLVGIGLIKLDKMFPFTVGANIGTTVTGILSALASSNIPTGLVVAFAHLFFNLFGTLIWFPILPIRAIPLSMAQGLGSLAADLRWFPPAYIFLVFGVLPGLLFLLSLAHWAALVFVGLPIIFMLVAVSCLFGFRAQKPNILPEFLKKDLSFFPPSMRMGNEAGAQEDTVVGTSDADLSNPRRWWSAPVVYGLGWFALIALWMVLPNAKWADIKFQKFDEREHIGIGAWSACGALFKDDVGWAPPPMSGASATAELQRCFGELQGSCTQNVQFSSKPGANKKYESSFYACKNVTSKDWEAKCLTMIDCGTNQKEQCTNVTSAIVRPYEIDYSASGIMWTAPSKDDYVHNPCIPLDSLCTDVGGVTTAGNLGTAGTVFLSLGLVMVVVYTFFNESKDMSKALGMGVASLVLSWILLLASWASFMSMMGQSTTCYIQNDNAEGIIAAKGKFGDIINGSGSYTYYYVIGAWLVLTLVIGVVILRVFEERRLPKPGQEVPVETNMDKEKV